MKLTGYEYIQHRIIKRPWGVECQYTVKDADGLIDSVVPVASEKIEEADLAKVIQAQLDARPIIEQAAPVDPVAEAVAAKEAEFKALLVEKELITAEQTIYDVKTKADYAQTTDEAVKP